MSGGRVHFSLEGVFAGNCYYMLATSALKCAVVRVHKVEVMSENTHHDIQYIDLMLFK